MQGVTAQADTATVVMMMFDEELQMTHRPPSGKLLILVCLMCNGKILAACQLDWSHGLVWLPSKQWKNTIMLAGWSSEQMTIYSNPSRYDVSLG